MGDSLAAYLQGYARSQGLHCKRGWLSGAEVDGTFQGWTVKLGDSYSVALREDCTSVELSPPVPLEGSLTVVVERQLEPDTRSHVKIGFMNYNDPVSSHSWTVWDRTVGHPYLHSEPFVRWLLTDQPTVIKATRKGFRAEFPGCDQDALFLSACLVRAIRLRTVVADGASMRPPPDDAVPFLARARLPMAEAPDRSDAIWRGTADIGQGERAVQGANTADRQAPEALHQARREASEGRRGDAIRTLEGLLARTPDLLAGYAALARCHLEVGNDGLGLRTIMRGLGVSNDCSELWYLLTHRFAAHNRIFDATLFLERALRRNPLLADLCRGHAGLRALVRSPLGQSVLAQFELDHPSRCAAHGVRTLPEHAACKDFCIACGGPASRVLTPKLELDEARRRLELVAGQAERLWYIRKTRGW